MGSVGAVQKQKGLGVKGRTCNSTLAHRTNALQMKVSRQNVFKRELCRSNCIGISFKSTES